MNEGRRCQGKKLPPGFAMSGVRWRQGDVPVKTEPGSNPAIPSSSKLHPIMCRTVASNPHVIELLAPLYPTIPSQVGEVTVHTVSLRRTADDWLQIVFPELSRPGKLLAMDVACVNRDDGGCRCDFVRLLRSVLVLTEKQIFRITTKYVITSIMTPSSSAGEGNSGAEVLKMATLQLFVVLHERVSRSIAYSLSEFDLVLSHLQAGQMAVASKSNRAGLDETVQRAKRSRCHVVGCELHPIEQDDTEPSQFTLDGVFQRLTTYVEVEQMPIRDDETYVARMKRAKREIILTDLPVTALHTFIRMLDARDLASISSSCSMFQHMAYEVVPGMKLLLYGHQRKGLKWLLYREGPSRPDLTSMTHPFVFPSVSLASNSNPQDETSQSYAIDLIDGKLVSQATVPHASDFRGGLFCDEPGLGKTITMLALVLRTKGQRSDPRRLDRPSSASRRSSVTLRSSDSRGRVLNPNELEASATTLIVVPNPLLDHWKYQIEVHLTQGALNVYVDDLEYKSVLPSPKELASYDVVITSFGRLSNEWKFGKPKSALEERMPDRYGFEDGPQRFIDGTINRGTSSLLLVHWVRIIVDEGHKLGGTNPADHMRMARLFHADKRWVMTGTPTPDTLRSADLRFLHGLLVFLRDHPYGDVDGKSWLKAIAKPFEQNERAGYVRLLHLLNRIMMRHTKESIKALIPTPIRHVVLIDPTPKEYAMYNGVAAIVRANLVIANMDPENPGKLHLDCVLNPINRKYAMEVMANLREATCGGGQIRALLSRESFAETINMLNANNVDPDRLAEVTAFMRKASSIDFLSQCTVCGRHLQLLMLVPCGHLMCADCVESRIETVGPSCGVCNATYDREDFQRLQPGFDFQRADTEWAYNQVPDESTATGTNGGVPRQNQQQRVRGRNDGSTIPVRERNGTRQRIIPIDLARFEAVNASKAFYVASRITELRKQYEKARTSRILNTSWKTDSQRPKEVKAIIFSQFKEHIWRVKVALAQQGIHCADFITGVSPALRMAGLHKFRNDPKSNVLMLTDVGSHGLDLSFVTHVFLMDEIWDKSLESQVVSRAHRMGAKQSVIVEQLLMRGSVEEVMHDMNKRRGGIWAEPEEEPFMGSQEHKFDHAAQHSSIPHVESRATKSLLSSHKKGTRRKQKGQAQQQHNSSQDSKSKSTMQQRQLHHVLQSLRLIEENAVAEFGFVKFKVIDDEGRDVRAASLHLPNPGLPPASSLSTATDRVFTPSSTTAKDSSGSVQQPPTASPSDPVRPAPAHDDKQKKKVKKTVRIKSEPVSAVVLSSEPVRPMHNGKQKMKKTVRIKFEEPSPVRHQSTHKQAHGDVIDLTSDGDSAGEERAPAERRSGAQQHYAFYKASSEEDDDEDDSETDDEWMPVKREFVKRGFVKREVEQSPHEVGQGKSKGKGKSQMRVVYDSDDE